MLADVRGAWPVLARCLSAVCLLFVVVAPVGRTRAEGGGAADASRSGPGHLRCVYRVHNVTKRCERLFVTEKREKKRLFIGEKTV